MLGDITNRVRSEGGEHPRKTAAVLATVLSSAPRYDLVTPPLDTSREPPPLESELDDPPIMCPSPMSVQMPVQLPIFASEPQTAAVVEPAPPPARVDDTMRIVDETQADLEDFAAQLAYGKDEALLLAVRPVMQKLAQAIDALKLNDDMYWFRDFHGTLVAVQETWYASEDNYSVSVAWVPMLLVPLLKVVLRKPTSLEGVGLYAAYDILATLRDVSLLEPADECLASYLLRGPCWGALVNLMARDEPEVPYQAFRTAKAIVQNAPISEEVLSKGTGMALGDFASPNAGARLYRYRMEIVEAIVGKIAAAHGPISDYVTLYLMRYAHQLEQAKPYEADVVLLRQIDDILRSIKSIIAETAAASPIVKRGRYYPTLSRYPALGRCPDPAPPALAPVSSLDTVQAFDRFFEHERDPCDLDSSLFRAADPPSPPLGEAGHAQTFPGPARPIGQPGVQTKRSWLRSWRSRADLAGTAEKPPARPGRFRQWLRRWAHPFQRTPADRWEPDFDISLDVEIPNWQLRSSQPALDLRVKPKL